MKDRTKYQGIFPAFYACYDRQGNIDPGRVEALTEFLVRKGVKGIYVGGSSGECIYQSVEERKLVLEHAVKAAAGRLTVIAHVACNNTKDSQLLAAHAQSLGVDAVAAIPPIYFRLPEHAIAAYWNDISAAAPDTDFIIYNIPQLAGVTLTVPLLRRMLENPRVIGVKNSSMPTQDILQFKLEGGEDLVVYNGPDEQLIAGLAAGADGGIGGTYIPMTELYLKIAQLAEKGDWNTALQVQRAASAIIYEMASCHGNLYAVLKEILRIREGLDVGGVRPPLPDFAEADRPRIDRCVRMIDEAIAKFCGA